MSIPARPRRSGLALFFLGLISAFILPAFAAPQVGIAPRNSKRDQAAAAQGQGGAGELVSGGAELRFPVMHVHGGMAPSGCYGYLYFSRDSVRYEVLGPDKFKDHSFEHSRADVVKVSDPGFFRKFPQDLAIQFRNGQTETFDHVNAQEVEKDRKPPLFGKYLLPREPLMLAFSNFDEALIAAGGTPGSPGLAAASSGYGAAASGGPISAGAPPPALPAPSPSAGFYADARLDFDVLDGVTVDPRKGTFTLLGHRSANGAARPVPYLDYFAAAMESSNPTFSLEWTPDSSRSIDRAFQMADQDLTNRLAGTVDATGHLTARGEWWYRMLGADVRQGMDKMSLWTAIFAVTGYPDAARVMKAVDALERGAMGNLSANQYLSLTNEFFNASIHVAMPNLDFATFAAVSNGAHSNNAQDRETYFSWGLRGMALAYHVDQNRYFDRYLAVERSGADWGTAFAKALELSQDDTVQVQKNAFGALVGDRTFIHIPPQIMSEVLGVSPVVVPVYTGLRPDSLLARVAFEADVFGKNLMDMPEIKAAVPTYRTYFEWRQTVARAPAAEGHTWFAPDGFELIESADGNTLRFGRTPIRVHMERYQNGASGRQSVEDPLLRQYADELTALYDPLAAQFPVLLDLRESMKVMAVADWLKRKGVKLSFPAQGRAAWTPPAQYPGVIHMEIAVKEAPVGEVMSASGGIDFRVDQNWKLLKQRIEEQPGPPPAGHTEVTENFDPASGLLAPPSPVQAGNANPPYLDSSVVDLRDKQQPLVPVVPQTANSAPARIPSPSPSPSLPPPTSSGGVSAPGAPIFDCAGDRAALARLTKGLAVQREAMNRTAAAANTAGEELAKAPADFAMAAIDTLNASATRIADGSEAALAREGALQSAGIPADTAARYKFLENLKRIAELSSNLVGATRDVPESYDAGRAFGRAEFAGKTARELSDQIDATEKLLKDSGLRDQFLEAAGGKLSVFLGGPVGEADFHLLVSGMNLLAVSIQSWNTAAEATQTAQNLASMRSEYAHILDNISELQQEVSQSCPNVGGNAPNN